VKVHILDDYFDTLRKLPSFGRLAGHEVTVWTDKPSGEAALADRLKDAEALVLFRDRTQITDSLVDKLPALRLVAMRSAYPNVDVEALTRRNILFCSNMHAGTPSIAAAELTFALMLDAARDLHGQISSIRSGNWQSGVGRSLNGRTLGLYGYGRIARVVAGYAKAFGMNVIWWASEAGRRKAVSDGETVAESRQAFFAAPDYVSVHKRMTPETRGEITLEDLSSMRSDAVFVNTSRAALVAPGALLEALKIGRPGRAAIDVYEQEPVHDPNHSLVSHPKVIPTPHIGFVTEDELDVQFADIYDIVNAYADGNPIHMINPEIRTQSG
jgi:D-3-phosphoglycerate dehydrogenase